MTPIEELRTLAEETVAKKGRVDSAKREQSAALITAIWQDPAARVEDTLGMLEVLNSEAVAKGISAAWVMMPADRRLSFRKWLPRPSSDRAARRLVLVAAAVMNHDGRMAAECLAQLISPHSGKTTKENRALLGNTFFTTAGFNFSNLEKHGTPTGDLLKVFNVLLDVAFDSVISPSIGAKAGFASAVADALTARNLGNVAEGEALKSKLLAESRKWPPDLRLSIEKRFESTMKTESATDAQPLDVKVPETGPGSSLNSVLAPEEKVEHSPDAKLDGMSPRSLRELIVRRMTSLKDELNSLQAMADFMDQTLEKINRQESVISHLQNEIKHLRKDLESALESHRSAKVDIQKSTDALAEHRTELSELRTRSEEDRQRLLQQISSTAAGRVEEFKNRVGMKLTKLVIDLPSKDVAVDKELGHIILLLFHQFLEACNEEGIPVRRK